jgi:hypothetical protein
MKEISNEKLNSKELNKILPSYLIDEIENNKIQNIENPINDFTKENNVIIIFFYNIFFYIEYF